MSYVLYRFHDMAILDGGAVKITMPWAEFLRRWEAGRYV